VEDLVRDSATQSAEIGHGRKRDSTIVAEKVTSLQEKSTRKRIMEQDMVMKGLLFWGI
jgi:hypothetical protein